MNARILSMLSINALVAVMVLTGCRTGTLSEAKALLESGDFLAARALYTEGVHQQPRDFSAQYGLGMSYCAEALYKTDLGLAIPDDWYPAIYHMTVASHLSNSPEVHKSLAIFHYNLGACYKKSGNRDEAIIRIEQAVSYDSSLVKAYNLLGALYHEAGEFTRAEQCYRRTLILKPDYAMAHFNLGALFWARNDYARAAEEFRNALALSPGNSYFTEWLDKSLAAQKAR